MKFLGVSGVFDYAGLSRSSRYRACSCCLPHIARTSASGLHLFGAEYPPRLSSVYASLSTSRYLRKTRGRADRYSFLVRNFHPLLHAGLSRRTAIEISRQSSVAIELKLSRVISRILFAEHALRLSRSSKRLTRSKQQLGLRWRRTTTSTANVKSWKRKRQHR
jgi:hypothetical protein